MRPIPSSMSRSTRYVSITPAVRGAALITEPRISRRSIPLNALRAFESVATYGGFGAAGKALWISPSSLSRHVSTVEAFCGSPLFDRRLTPLVLTATGKRLLAALRNSFDKIEEALQEIRTGDEDCKRILRLQMPQSIATHFAMPALREFTRSNSDMDIELVTPGDITAGSGDFDVAVVRLEAGDVKLGAEHLWQPRLSVVCHPDVIARAPPLELQDFIDANVIAHVRSKGMPPHHAWNRFIVSAGMPHIDVRRGPIFDSDLLARQYLLSGEGIALLDIYLFADEISAGRLVRPFGHELADGPGYYLISRPGGSDDPRLSRFRSWLLSCMGNRSAKQHERLIFK
jgi:DNA-binding transcriptional LysR family regulator